ncbi:hypothetical protein A8B75_18610 [Sphingomonadales bacterium EhC05]|nr:hypothetical protein A8B75_18610 [Sphingomonadales bacterium EhC05]
MTAIPSLKEQNRYLIRTAMVLHCAAFIWVVMLPQKLNFSDINTILSGISASLVPGAIGLGVVALASLFLLGIIPPKRRDQLIHWRRANPLPGSRAFTKIGPKADHIDMAELERCYGPLPSDEALQNITFFSIYNRFRDKAGVVDAHRRYLAARDIGTITVTLVPILPLIGIWATGDMGRSLLYATFLIGTYSLCAIAAQNYSVRMVQHVLAAASVSEYPITGDPK